MTTVRNVELTPAMWQALTSDFPWRAGKATVDALEQRGLLTVGRTPDEPLALTDAGRALRATREAQSVPACGPLASGKCPHCDAASVSAKVQTCERHTHPELAAREMVTVTVPRALADAVTAAWTEAYRTGAPADFLALAAAYDALRDCPALDGHLWLTRALLDARSEAQLRSEWVA